LRHQKTNNAVAIDDLLLGFQPCPSANASAQHDGFVPPEHITYSTTDKLVRFRKNLTTTVPCAVAQANWERLIKPLFPEEQLVDQSLVEVRPGKVIAKLSEELRGWEIYTYPTKGSLRSSDPRPTKRQGIYLADDDHGLLITDMSPRKYFAIETLAIAKTQQTEITHQAKASGSSSLSPNGSYNRLLLPPTPSVAVTAHLLLEETLSVLMKDWNV
jgi:hypothetical protein